MLHQKKTLHSLDKELPQNILSLMGIYFNFEMKHFVINEKANGVSNEYQLFQNSPKQDVFKTVHDTTYNIFEISNEYGVQIAKLFMEQDK